MTRKLISIYILWSLIIYSLAVIAFQLFPKDSYSGKMTFTQAISNWDADRYLRIAKNGYTEDSQYAFFPLYPLLIRLIAPLIGYLPAALSISSLSALFGLILLFKYLSRKFNSKEAYRVVIYVLIFPTSFYFLLPYSEGLFFFLTTLCFYFLSQKKFTAAAAVCGLVSGTRPVGLAMVAALLTYYLSKNRSVHIKDFLSIVLLSLSGFIAYCIYMYLTTGYPFYFLVSQLDWNRSLSIPGIGIYYGIADFLKTNSVTAAFVLLSNVIFAAIGIGLSLRAFRFLPKELAVYSISSLIIPLITPTLISIPRFLLVNFPVFVLINQFKDRKIVIGYCVVSVALLLAYLTLFINGYWVS